MRDITVLDVGDGACSVLRDEDPVATAVIDCGSNNKGMRTAAAALAATLGAPGLASLDGLVVTHYDHDHWLGLRLLPSLITAGQVPADIPIYMPHVPLAPGNLFAEHVVALLSTLGQHPV